MKKLILAASVLAVTTVSAFAADMAVKAPVYKAPEAVYSWTGFYIGANAGYGQNDSTGSRTCYNDVGVFFGTGCTANIVGSTVRPSGALAGGTAGYNVQAGQFLYGVEADIQWSDIKASATVPIGVPVATGLYSASDDLRWFGTVRGRLGILATPQLLLYATGGLIYGDESVSAVTSFPSGFIYPATGSSTRTGGIVGAGLEYAFTKTWSAKLEGLYYDMGHQNVGYLCPAGSATCTPGYTEGGTFAQRGVIVRGGLNWHFNWDGAVVAKY